MSQFYTTVLITELGARQEPFPAPLTLVPKAPRVAPRYRVHDRCFADWTWIVLRDKRRFQVMSFSFETSGMLDVARSFHAAYRFVVVSLVDITRPLLVMGGDNSEVFLSLLEGPEESKAAHFRAMADPTIDGELKAEHHKLWTHPIDMLAQNRLADLQGWLVYLGKPLVDAFGRQKLVQGPWFRVASAPDGLYLELRSGIVLWNEKAGRRQYVPDLRVQRSYLGIDASWMDRYMELLGILNKFLDEARKSRR